MTIIIQTAEFLGLLTDVKEFAAGDKDDAFHGVLLQWHTEEGAAHLTAEAYDGVSGAQALWEPYDDATSEVGEGQTKSEVDVSDIHWGDSQETEPAFRAYIDLADVRDLIKVFKVAPKLWALPLRLSVTPTGSTLEVRREAAHGKPAATVTVSANPNRAQGQFPDIAGIVQEAGQNTAAAESESYWPYLLGRLGAVRQHDAVTLTFPNVGSPTTMRMGYRWCGFVYSPRETRAAQDKRAALLV